MADRLLGLGQIDDGAAFHAAGLGVADTEYLDAVAAPAQHLLRRLRLEAGDQAHDLAGADVEGRHDRRTPRRDRLHLGREAVAEAHALPPFFFGEAS